jgi:predicted aspartyl protease
MARPLAFVIVTMTVANATNAMAQYDQAQCAQIINQLTTYTQANAFKQIVRLARVLGSYCQRDLPIALESLSSGLNGDNQHEEALAVANRCLQMNDVNVQFFCWKDKAEALYGLGRVEEAEATVERALRQPAVTEWDVATKKNLREFLDVLNGFAAYGRPPDPAMRNQPQPSQQSNVPLSTDGGVFVVPVENSTITLDFAVDSGAADVSIPLDVFSTLKRTGTVKDSDILGQRTYVLADGSKSQSVSFRIRSLKVGNRILENVTASVAPSGGMLLLGQSFLGRFKAWSIDNASHKLVLEPQ